MSYDLKKLFSKKKGIPNFAFSKLVIYLLTNFNRNVIIFYLAARILYLQLLQNIHKNHYQLPLTCLPLSLYQLIQFLIHITQK